jgi:hypothetical protein
MEKNQKILIGVVAVLVAAAALIFRAGIVTEEVKAEVTLLNNSVLLKDNVAKEESEVMRVTVTAKNADVFPKSFALGISANRDLNCEIWTAYKADKLAEGSGNNKIKLFFKEGVRLEKDTPITWLFLCNLSQLADGETIQANLKTDPASLEWEGANRQLFREITLLTDNLVGPEISN